MDVVDITTTTGTFIANGFAVHNCGKTGEELNATYLPLAGLSRSDIYVSNAFKCSWADAKDTPPDHIVRSCAEFHLRKEIERVRPKVVILMGGIANSLIDRKVELHHGTAVNADLLGYQVDCFSSYHPARGLHQSSTMQQLLDDFRKLKLFLHGDIGLVEDLHPNPTYYRLTTADEVDAILAHRTRDTMAVDTESSKTWKGYRNTIKYITYCATFCLDMDEAFLVMRSDKAAWDRLCMRLARWRGKLLLHNLPHDYRAFAQAGCQLPWEQCVDTMSEAYTLANVAKGLKPLAYQLLGSSARSFDDVVRPYGIRAVMDYLATSSLEDWPMPPQVGTGEMVEKKCQECGGSSVIKTTGVAPCGECFEGLVAGKKPGKYKKCPACKGTCQVKTAEFTECTACDLGYVTEEKMSRKQGLGQKLRRMVGDYAEGRVNMETFDPWDRLNNWVEDGTDIQPMIDMMGPPPLDSVDLVPVEELIDYAGADAKNTRGIHPVLVSRLVALRRGRKYV